MQRAVRHWGRGAHALIMFSHNMYVFLCSFLYVLCNKYVCFWFHMFFMFLFPISYVFDMFSFSDFSFSNFICFLYVFFFQFHTFFLFPISYYFVCFLFPISYVFYMFSFSYFILFCMPSFSYFILFCMFFSYFICV